MGSMMRQSSSSGYSDDSAYQAELARQRAAEIERQRQEKLRQQQQADAERIQREADLARQRAEAHDRMDAARSAADDTHPQDAKPSFAERVAHYLGEGDGLTPEEQKAAYRASMLRATARILQAPPDARGGWTGGLAAAFGTTLEELPGGYERAQADKRQRDIDAINAATKQQAIDTSSERARVLKQQTDDSAAELALRDQYIASLPPEQRPMWEAVKHSDAAWSKLQGVADKRGEAERQRSESEIVARTLPPELAKTYSDLAKVDPKYAQDWLEKYQLNNQKADLKPPQVTSHNPEDDLYIINPVTGEKKLLIKGTGKASAAWGAKPDPTDLTRMEQDAANEVRRRTFGKMTFAQQADAGGDWHNVPLTPDQLVQVQGDVRDAYQRRLQSFGAPSMVGHTGTAVGATTDEDRKNALAKSLAAMTPVAALEKMRKSGASEAEIADMLRRIRSLR